MSQVLSYDRESVRWIIFNRPEKLNALTHENILEAKQIVKEACETMNGIVFMGAGERAFSAGIDLNTFQNLNSQTARILISDLKAILETIRKAPIPTISAVNGYCIGGAMELVMVCDIRIAVETAKFGLPEIKVGIPSVLDASLL